jgi:hypothetical protein
MGWDWWATFYGTETGDMVLYRIRGNPVSCYDDIGQLSPPACSAYQACLVKTAFAEPLFEVQIDQAELSQDDGRQRTLMRSVIEKAGDC